MGPNESHQKKVFRKNPNMGLQAILKHTPLRFHEKQFLKLVLCKKRENSQAKITREIEGVHQFQCDFQKIFGHFVKYYQDNFIFKVPTFLEHFYFK